MMNNFRGSVGSLATKFGELRGQMRNDGGQPSLSGLGQAFGRAGAAIAQQRQQPQYDYGYNPGDQGYQPQRPQLPSQADPRALAARFGGMRDQVRAQVPANYGQLGGAAMDPMQAALLKRKQLAAQAQYMYGRNRPPQNIQPQIPTQSAYSGQYGRYGDLGSRMANEARQRYLAGGVGGGLSIADKYRQLWNRNY